MTSHAQRSGDAAIRVLEARVQGAELDLMDLQLAAWAAGKAGRQPPALANALEAVHVRQAAAFGAGNHELAFSILSDQLAADPQSHLLVHACHLAGDRYADTLLEHAARSSGCGSGPMLVRTQTPLRLLALVDSTKQYDHIVATVSELVIHGRDVGAPVAEIEDRWTALHAPAARPYNLRAFREAELRIAARENMEDAIERMLDDAAARGYDEQDEGTEAVLGRLVRTDPERACAIVAECDDPANQIAWLRPIVRWLELPAPAAPIIDALLAREAFEDQLLLASPLVLARAFDRLDTLLRKHADVPADQLARSVAVAIARLREADLHDDVETARARMLAAIGSRTVGRVAPADLLDVLSAAPQPSLVPWRPEPGIP